MVFRIGCKYSFASVAGRITRASIMMTSSSNSVFNSVNVSFNLAVRSSWYWGVSAGSSRCSSLVPTIGWYNSSKAEICPTCELNIETQASLHAFDASIIYRQMLAIAFSTPPLCVTHLGKSLIRVFIIVEEHTNFGIVSRAFTHQLAKLPVHGIHDYRIS